MNDLKQYLYRIVPTRPGMLTEGPTGEEASILDQHVAYLGDLKGVGGTRHYFLVRDPDGHDLFIATWKE